jgi:hypothetical protein
MADLKNWNFFNKNVQSGLMEGRFMNAAFLLLAAGPPRLAAVLPESTQLSQQQDVAYPIGVLQSIQIGIQANIMRLFEIGSMRSYYIRGRVVGNVSLSRVQYHGPNLLRVLYAYLSSEDPDFSFEALYDNTARAKLNTNPVPGGKQRYQIKPGYENLWMELGSDVFDQPIGLLLYMKDSNDQVVGAFYLENCNVANYGWGADSNNTIITENTGILYERMVPVNVRPVGLIRNKDSDAVTSVVGSGVVGAAA